MKKIGYFICLLFMIIVLTGCTNYDMECIKKTDTDINKFTATIKMNFNKEKIKYAEAIITYKKEGDASSACKQLNINGSKNIKCNKKSIVIEKYQNVLTDVVGNSLTKTDMIKKLEEQGYNCK